VAEIGGSSGPVRVSIKTELHRNATELDEDGVVVVVGWKADGRTNERTNERTSGWAMGVDAVDEKPT
jgi:hypothetical protein